MVIALLSVGLTVAAEAGLDLLRAPAEGDLVVAVQDQGNVDAGAADCVLLDASVWDDPSPSLEAWRAWRKPDAEGACAWNGVPRGRYRVALFAPQPMWFFGSGASFLGEADVRVPGRVDFLRTTPFIADARVAHGGEGDRVTVTLVNPGPLVTAQVVCTWGGAHERVEVENRTMRGTMSYQQQRTRPVDLAADASHQAECRLPPDAAGTPLLGALVRVRAPGSSDDGMLHGPTQEDSARPDPSPDWRVSDTWRRG